MTKGEAEREASCEHVNKLWFLSSLFTLSSSSSPQLIILITLVGSQADRMFPAALPRCRPAVGESKFSSFSCNCCSKFAN